MLALKLNHTSLWLHILAGLGYSTLALSLDQHTATVMAEGVVGVLLGLYVCSCPARNTIDVLFADRFAAGRIWAAWDGRTWLALNALALVSGTVAIMAGLVRLIGA
jgi:hypothetical protein